MPRKLPDPADQDTTFEEERLIPLREAAQFFPRPPSSRTMVNRVREGCWGVKLKATFDGYRYWTSQQWVREFLEAVSAARQMRIDHLTAPVETPSEQCRRAHERILRL